MVSFEQQAEAKAGGNHAYRAGWVHRLRRQADEVLACAERAAAHWQTAQSGARERAIAIQLRGIGHQLKQDYPAAIAASARTLDLDRSLFAESGDVAFDLNALAEAERLSADLAAAERDYREALRIARAVGYAEGVATCTGNLAASWRCTGKTGRGPRPWPGEALPLSEDLGRQELTAEDCRLLAKALVRQGKPTEARRPARGGDLHPAWLA